MKAIKCQVKLSKVCSNGWKSFLPIWKHFIYYIYIHINTYIYIYMYVYIYIYIYIWVLHYPPPAFWPPCHLQNVMACRRNDRTCIYLCKNTQTHVFYCMLYNFIVLYIIFLISDSEWVDLVWSLRVCLCIVLFRILAKSIPHTRSQTYNLLSKISEIWKGPSEEHSTHQISKT